MTEIVKFVEKEVTEALKARFGADAVEPAADGTDHRRRYTVLFDATGCFLIEIVGVCGGVSLVNPDENRRAVERQHAAA